MERDPKRSSRHWYGIFTFKDIICDGEAYSGPEKREGGLKMGGTYWYHVSIRTLEPLTTVFHCSEAILTDLGSVHAGRCIRIP